MPASPTEPAGARLTSASGLTVECNANGSLRRFACGGVSLALFVANELEGGPANLYLRLRGDRLRWTPLLGPASPTRFEADSSARTLAGSGCWEGIEYTVALVLAATAPTWFWHVRLHNTLGAVSTLDLTYAQDLALAAYGAVRMNEYYVSQYVDHTPLAHPQRGIVLASRQNQAVDGAHPWSLIGSLRRGVAFATDALELHGLASRAGRAPLGVGGELPGHRLQREHSMAVIRDEPIALAPGATLECGFFGTLVPDHPAVTSAADLERLSEVLRAVEAAAPAQRRLDSGAELASLFAAPVPLAVAELTAAELSALFGATRRLEERDERGALLSFFHGEARHVVLRAKELAVLRPHGHLLRTGLHTTPDERSLTSTAWMGGVFHSMLTQGHVSINRFLSTVRSYLGLFRSHGQRVFIESDGAWRLLDVPSAFEMWPEGCRWIYRHTAGVLEVRAEAANDRHEMRLAIEVRSGPPVRFLITHHVALNGDDGAARGAVEWRREGDVIVATPAPGSELARRFPRGSFRIRALAGTAFERIGGDELLFRDGRSRLEPYLCLVTAPACAVALALTGHLIDEQVPPPQSVPSRSHFVRALSMSGGAAPAHAQRRLAGLAEIAPWLAHDALVHYLAPRGLEQYSGGGWGTRDVCQGPVEMLLALGLTAPLRDLLLRVMSAQNADGDWPQWFSFYERERAIRAADAHGDIIFWPLLVLGQYLIASGDAALLDERVPFFDPRGPAAGEPLSVWQHAERALDAIGRRSIAGTALCAYGHGDWNDSLQPADPSMRARLCSAWTVTLHHQTFRTLARALRAVGRAAQAPPLERSAAAVASDLQRLLVADGVLAGYALFAEDGTVRHLLHPRDEVTGVHLSSLAMVHALLEDLLTPAQVTEHLRLIEEHLCGPDGLRLFDRPLPYRGGEQRVFQRAESATYFGREIGLMYMHAHLRYAQALAHLGQPDRFWRALCQANPIDVGALVAAATVRQANCYYSSSDAAFDDRYQAQAEYQRVARGTVALEGGWRVYSSGAGIALGLIVRTLLGLDYEANALRIDPVMPRDLDGVCAEIALYERPVSLEFRIGPRGCGVVRIEVNARPIDFELEPNPHRRGAARVAKAALLARLAPGRNVLAIEIG